MVIIFLQCSKKHSMEHKICPRSNGQNWLNGANIYHVPSWPTPLGQFCETKRCAMTSFAGGAIKKRCLLLSSIFLNCYKLVDKVKQIFKGGATRNIFMRVIWSNVA